MQVKCWPPLFLPTTPLLKTFSRSGYQVASARTLFTTHWLQNSHFGLTSMTDKLQWQMSSHSWWALHGGGHDVNGGQVCERGAKWVAWLLLLPPSFATVCASVTQHHCKTCSFNWVWSKTFWGLPGLWRWLPNELELPAASSSNNKHPITHGSLDLFFFDRENSWALGSDEHSFALAVVHAIAPRGRV